MAQTQPDHTAVRTALWRALHAQADAKPSVLVDTAGLDLAAPEPGWQQRPDMGPFTKPFRASIVARARFLEDLVQERVALGTAQYVILGAGLDTFAQRRTDLVPRTTVFEVDQPGTQAWKRERLERLGWGVPPHLRLVPVDFEKGESWVSALVAQGFDRRKPAVVACTGVSMYLTQEAVAALLQEVADFAPGSVLALSFLVPMEMVDADIRVGVERAAAGAAAGGTPWLSFFRPVEIVDLAMECGFREVRHVSSGDLARQYFAGRSDGLRPPESAEDLLVASA
jgi:methyltransferase (TIGR00027 family)